MDNTEGAKCDWDHCQSAQWKYKVLGRQKNMTKIKETILSNYLNILFVCIENCTDYVYSLTDPL